jgi:hypothetical protein
MKTLYHARLFTSEEDGETHFEDVPVDLEREFLVQPNAPLPCSLPMTAEGVFWIGAPQHWKCEKAHPALSRRLFVTLKGEYQVRASDGQTRKFPVGSVLVLDDVTGDGHATEVTSPEGVTVLAVSLRSRSHPAFRD